MQNTYEIRGLTCEHCARAVHDEVAGITGVTDVSVELVADGVSTLHVSSGTPLADEQIASALDEAGDYTLAGQS